MVKWIDSVFYPLFVNVLDHIDAEFFGRFVTELDHFFKFPCCIDM